jgi:RNA polymerase sigma factor (sigma-70 family)
MRALLSDERLSLRLASGEAEAFDELYRRYVHRLAAYAGSLLGDGAAGEDVAQVSLLNAYQALRRGKAPEKVRPWLYRIAHNEAVDMLARRRELLQGIDLEERPAPEDGSEVRGALLQALAQLPDRQRRAYVLREVHGLRVAEIAAELALAVPQVEQALFAARNRLAEELVFGNGLTCEAARRLSEGPLATIERRALRRHFRTCDGCRATGIRVAPGLTLDWLRARLTDLLVGGAAPAAAKVTAVVAASVATGVTGVAGPGLVERPRHVAPARQAVALRAPSGPSQARPVAPQKPLAALDTRAPRSVDDDAHRSTHERSERSERSHRDGEDRGEDHAPPATADETRHGSSGGDDGHRDELDG